MYRRYTNTDREGSSPNQLKQLRIRNIIILVLLAGLVAGAIYTIPLFRYRNEMKDLYIQTMISEYGSANKTIGQDLGPYKNAKTEEARAEIRSNLYAIQILNRLHKSQNGQLLIPENSLKECIGRVDEFLDAASKGNEDTTVPLSNLRNALNLLNEELNDLE